MSAKQEQMKRKGVASFSLALKAQIGATRFFWDGQLPEPATQAEQQKAYELVADAAIASVHILAGSSSTRVTVDPSESADDSRTIQIRDSLYRTLDATDTGIATRFNGTPLRPGGAPVSLELGAFQVPYTEALAYVKRVDAAVPEIRVEQVAGDTPSVIIDGPEDRLGWAYVNKPLAEQPDDPSEWSLRMQELFASDA